MILPEITKVQLQQSVETYRVLLSLLVQICTVFVLADATTVGYAVQQKLAGIIWVGAIFPMVMYLIMRVVVRMTIPVLATAVEIETKYKDSEVGGLISTFVAVAISPSFLEGLRAATLLIDEPDRAKALSAINKPYVFAGSLPVKHTLLLIMVCHATVPILLWRFAGWALLSR